MQPSIAKTAPLALIVPVFICLSLARSAVWGGDMLLWSNTVKCAPSSSTGHENLGNAYAARGEYGKALKEYTSASKCPDIKELQKLEYNRGLVFKSIGRYKDAEDSFFNALRLDPSYAQPHFSLGAIAEMRGNYTLAQFHFQRAIEKEPQNALAYYIAGRQRFIHAAGRDDQRQAFLLLSRSVGLNPLDANAHAALGAVMINLGDRRGALHELESALTLDPVNVPALQLMRKYHVSAEHKTIYYTLYAHSNWYGWLTLFLIIFLSLSAVFYIRYLIIINE
jgi:tetratricopeptide (TPR) repeat protein